MPHEREHALDSDNHSGTISDAQHGTRGATAQHAIATVVTDGFMSAIDKTKLDGLSSVGKSMFMFGNSNVSGTTTTRYLNPSFADSLASLTKISFRMPFACTLRNLYVRQNNVNGNGNAIVYTILVNGVASALTVSMASTANDGNDTTHTAAVAAGDLIDLEVTKALSVGTSPSDIVATVEAN